MTSSISNLIKSLTPYIPEAPRFRLSTPSEMINKVTKLAIPLMALAALDQAQGAEAFGLGTFACVACLCSGMAPACIIPCGIALVTAPVPGY